MTRPVTKRDRKNKKKREIWSRVKEKVLKRYVALGQKEYVCFSGMAKFCISNCKGLLSLQSESSMNQIVKKPRR